MASISKRQRQRLSKAQRRQRRQRQTRKTRAVRRQLRHLHDQLPRPARLLCDTLGHAFTKATALRFSLLFAAALLTIGRHTIANLLRTLGPLVPGDASCYRRLFSQRRWSSWRLAKLLSAWLLEHLLPDGPILLAADDTVDEHRGKKVYGKDRHRDPVRSTHSTRLSAGDISGSSSPCWSLCPSRAAVGPCRSWWLCTAPSRTIADADDVTRRRPNC